MKKKLLNIVLCAAVAIAGYMFITNFVEGFKEGFGEGPSRPQQEINVRHA